MAFFLREWESDFITIFDLRFCCSSNIDDIFRARHDASYFMIKNLETIYLFYGLKNKYK